MYVALKLEIEGISGVQHVSVSHTDTCDYIQSFTFLKLYYQCLCVGSVLSMVSVSVSMPDKL